MDFCLTFVKAQVLRWRYCLSLYTKCIKNDNLTRLDSTLKIEWIIIKLVKMSAQRQYIGASGVSCCVLCVIGGEILFVFLFFANVLWNCLCDCCFQWLLGKKCSKEWFWGTFRLLLLWLLLVKMRWKNLFLHYLWRKSQIRIDFL